MGVILTTRTLQPHGARADRLTTTLLLAVAMALSAPSTTWAQNHQLVPQPSGHPASTGSETIVASGNLYTGALTHLLHERSGQPQAQTPGSPPSAAHRSTKPPL
jgi:hypothetical protein